MLFFTHDWLCTFPGGCCVSVSCGRRLGTGHFDFTSIIVLASDQRTHAGGGWSCSRDRWGGGFLPSATRIFLGCIFSYILTKGLPGFVTRKACGGQKPSVRCSHSTEALPQPLPPRHPSLAPRGDLDMAG